MNWRPYAVQPGTLTVDQIQSWCGDVRASLGRLGLLNDFGDFKKLVSVLKRSKSFDILPMRDYTKPRENSAKRLFIRFDCDADIGTAVLAGEFLHAMELTASFYLLHTSTYYGEFKDGIFYRQPGIEELARQLVASGQEVGLHIDPLHLYLNLGIDGTSAVLAELDWLRRVGIAVAGVAAHNSAYAYGAENFEIFKGMAFGDRKCVSKNGSTAPLQTIDMHAAGLSYEANFSRTIGTASTGDPEDYLNYAPKDALRDRRWMDYYLLNNPFIDRPNHVSAWLTGDNTWAYARHHPQKHLDLGVATPDVLAKFLSEPEGTDIFVVLHPEYFGRRLWSA